MSRVAIFVLILLISGCAMDSGKNVLKDHNGWKLVWQDEFNGDEINRDKWDFDIGGDGFGNEESQYYTNRPENAFIDQGKLVIQARKESYNGNPYTSAKLITKGKADWTYGRFEVRAKLPEGKGIWPAIWMMPTDMKRYGGWPSCGEIDIMELLGHEPNKIYGTLHMGNPHDYTSGTIKLTQGTFAEQFHVFAVEWTPTQIRWYMDDKLYYSLDDWFTRENGTAEKKPFPAPFDRAFYMQLNLAVGGKWPGYPDETTTFPQRFEIDYVRVYQNET